MSTSEKTILEAFKASSNSSSALPPIPYDKLAECMQDEALYNKIYKENFERLVKEKFTSKEYSIFFGSFPEPVKKAFADRLYMRIQGSGCEIHIFTTNPDAQHYQALKINFENCSDEAHNLADKAAGENRLQYAEKQYGPAAKAFFKQLDTFGNLPDEIEHQQEYLDFLKGTLGQFLAKTYHKSIEDIVATCCLFDQFRVLQN